MKVKGPDGYLYEPVWLNPAEADSRGIAHGDIVKIFNERGIVLGGAYVTERLMPGWPTWITGPGGTRSSPASWTAGGRSTPSHRTRSRPRTPRAWS